MATLTFKPTIRWCVGIALCLVLSNFFWPVRLALGLVMDKAGYRDTLITGPLLYSTLHGEIQPQQDGVITFDGTWGSVKRKLVNYRECYPTSPDTVLYRLYALKPYQFWEYINYYVQPQWQLPYLSPDQIRPPLSPRPVSVCPKEHPDWRD